MTDGPYRTRSNVDAEDVARAATMPRPLSQIDRDRQDVRFKNLVYRLRARLLTISGGPDLPSAQEGLRRAAAAYRELGKAIAAEKVGGHALGEALRAKSRDEWDRAVDLARQCGIVL